MRMPPEQRSVMRVRELSLKMELTHSENRRIPSNVKHTRLTAATLSPVAGAADGAAASLGVDEVGEWLSVNA